MSSTYEFDTNRVAGSGNFIIGIAGAVLGNHKLVYMDATGRWQLADADLAATLPVLGLTLAAANTGRRVKILIKGYVGDPAWAWVVGDEIYASSTPGELTQVAAGLVQIVGMAGPSTDFIYFSPKDTGAGGVVCALLEGHTAYVGFDICKGDNYTNYWTCDGVADDVQIQLAINYAGAREGSAFIEANLPTAPYYDITAPLSLTGFMDITVQGAARSKGLAWNGGGWSPGGTYLRLANGVDDHLLEKIEVVSSKHTGLTIRDLNFVGNNANQTGAADSDVLHFEQCKFGVIDNVTVVQGLQNLISMEVCEGWRIINSEIRADGNTEDSAIFMDYGSGNMVDNCIILGASAVGSNAIDLWHSDYCKISQSTITDSYFGIDIRTSSDYNTIINCDVSDNDHTSIRIREASSYNKITNCNIRNVTQFDGVNIGGGGVDIGNMIINNHIDDNNRYGVNIAAAGALANVVKGNRFTGNGTGAFADTSTANNTVIPEHFAPVSDPNATLGDHPVVDLPYDTDTYVYAQIPVTMEYQELYECNVIVVPAASGDMVWTVDTDFGRLCSSEDYNAHSDSGGDTDTIVIDDLECIDITAALTDIAAGDLIGVKFMRDGNNVADTIDDSVYYLGIRMRYV